MKERFALGRRNTMDAVARVAGVHPEPDGPTPVSGSRRSEKQWLEATLQPDRDRPAVALALFRDGLVSGASACSPGTSWPTGAPPRDCQLWGSQRNDAGDWDTNERLSTEASGQTDQSAMVIASDVLT